MGESGVERGEAKAGVLGGKDEIGVSVVTIGTT